MCVYNIKSKQIIKKAIANELCVDEREVFEFVLVYACDDIFVRRRSIRFFSCEIDVKISNVRS